MNTTQSLLAGLILVIALCTLVLAVNINLDSQSTSYTDSYEGQVMYAVDNPHLQEELNTRILVPARVQGTVGAR